MNTKYIGVALISVVLLAIAYVLSLFQAPVETRIPREMADSPETLRYEDPSLGLSFSYRAGPGGLVARSETFGPEEMPLRAAILLLTEEDANTVESLEASEGPPTISILVFKRGTSTPREWIDTNPAYSNAPLIVDEAQDIVFGGVPAVRYMTDGLYRTDTTVIAHGDLIFILYGAFLEEDSLIRTAYLELLDSLELGVQESTTNSAEGAPEGSVHNLPVPPGVSAVKKKAARDTGVKENSVVVMMVEDLEWPDGCLGLAEEGQICTQALVPGHRVTVNAGDEERVYRVNLEGTIIREE